jgi:hypothetical protein
VIGAKTSRSMGAQRVAHPKNRLIISRFFISAPTLQASKSTRFSFTARTFLLSRKSVSSCAVLIRNLPAANWLCTSPFSSCSKSSSAFALQGDLALRDQRDAWPLVHSV